MRKVDIAHSGQTVPEAMEQLKNEIRTALRRREKLLLLVHGYGASGTGGAIRASLAAELPRWAKTYRFKFYSMGDRIPRELNLDSLRLNQGTTLLAFADTEPDRKPTTPEFRPNFRNLRSTVRVRPKPLTKS
jgi:hypothetical protein